MVGPISRGFHNPFMEVRHSESVPTEIYQEGGKEAGLSDDEISKVISFVEKRNFGDTISKVPGLEKHSIFVLGRHS